MNTATLGVDVFEGIQWIQESGFEFVEVSCGDIANRDDYVHSDQIASGFVKQLQDACAPFDSVTVHPETPTAFLVQDADGRSRAIEQMCRFIGLAEALGARLLTFHAGKAPADTSEEELRSVLSDSFGRLVAQARSRGVRLGLEVVPGCFGTATAFEVLDKLELPDLGITLDIGHLSFPHPNHPGKPSHFPLASIGEFIERFSHRFVHLHVHDYDGHHDHIPIGQGAIDFPNVIDSLRRIGYDGTICFEFTPKVARADILESKRRWQALVDAE